MIVNFIKTLKKNIKITKKKFSTFRKIQKIKKHKKIFGKVKIFFFFFPFQKKVCANCVNHFMTT